MAFQQTRTLYFKKALVRNETFRMSAVDLIGCIVGPGHRADMRADKKTPTANVSLFPRTLIAEIVPNSHEVRCRSASRRLAASYLDL